jgi:hypothetical protein
MHSPTSIDFRGYDGNRIVMLRVFRGREAR